MAKKLTILIVVSLVFIFSFNIVLAQDLTPNLQVPLGDFDSSDFGINPGDWIGQYIAAIYRYGVGIAAFLAVVMMMVGGLIWLTSAGKRGQIETGQDFIKSALLGLLLAMFSFILLFTINPRLTIFQPLNIVPPDLRIDIYVPGPSCCSINTGATANLNENGSCNQGQVMCAAEQSCGCIRRSIKDELCVEWGCVGAINPLNKAVNCLKNTEIFKKLNARVTATSGGNHTSGSCHYLGLAADIAWGGGQGTDDMANTSSADKSAFESAARSCGFNVISPEIQCPSYCNGNCEPGQCVWSAPHYHLAVCSCTRGGYDQQCASGN